MGQIITEHLLIKIKKIIDFCFYFLFSFKVYLNSLSSAQWPACPKSGAILQTAIDELFFSYLSYSQQGAAKHCQSLVLTELSLA